MADFVAVLRKTIDGLGETTPEMRRRVYEKARATVANKLAALNPPPPATVAERQKKTLEDAIAEVEASFAPPPRAADPSDPLAELENVFASLKAKPVEIAPLSTARTQSYAEAKPWPVTTPKPAAETPKPAADTLKPAAETPKAAAPKRAPETPKADFPPVARSEPESPEADDFDAVGTPAAGDQGFHGQHETEDELEMETPRRRRGVGRLIAAAVAIVALAGGGYAAWLNRDQLASMLDIGGEQIASTGPATDPAGAPPLGTLPPPDEPAGTAARQEPETPETPKFTQRLNADGSETDVGPAGGEAGVGEGTSVASVTPPAAGQPPAATAATPDQATAATEGTAPATDGTTAGATPTPPAAETPGPSSTPPAAETPGPASTPPAAGTPGPASTPATQVAVGQKAIFYEERTSSAQGSAEAGQVVWSVVQESPGNDQPPEAAIRGEATIPGKDLQLRMTIRRNADQTLPASHIIELIFLTPENFEGGGIDNILRFALKGTEEAAGSPLIGIPAKIADGFFLVALNDSKAETDANLTLLRREKWIDVPVIYKSGRRALITMEKGIPGDKVFDEALKAWQTANAG